MCVVNRTTSEPGSHYDCARYAVRACPFMVNPRMRRNEVNQVPGQLKAPGLHVDHNPGVMALWTTCHVKPFDGGAGGFGRPGTLFRFLDEPQEVSWWRNGGLASRAEVEQAMAKGLPALRAIAVGEDALPEFEAMVADAQRFLPGMSGKLKESDDARDP
jgi:hypothetical protein